ncbi:MULTISPECIES: 2-keto-4-pentenoate hydratase [Streptomyces violaceusniger group]|uniref:Fumarylacetoacetate hydrolase family protein n=2 Tax=Streptomyces violaceusniger group TaxID=2839105 RepID=A0ABD5JHU6_9ACTN|nr:fumarylacetoacetate hydrolase family protein [Streptomyces violaceusniger]KUL66414.1 4-oxalocrotonate decarboxylase [Streptomyces violaceusniger]MEE4587223.1 fumarylacetoacetate hydrolase family protein [Streptomyces sp. DSM 41602]
MTWTAPKVAHTLLDAENRRQDLEPFTDEWAELDLEVAYQIQDETLARRVMRGEQIVGVKLGLTSRAKQQRMGVDSPLTAWLTDAMVLGSGVPVPLNSLIHPRVEPEIVFQLGKPLAGPGVTAMSALAAVEAVYAGIEVIDSRYKDFRFRLADVVADNASSGRIVAGSVALPPQRLDLALEACVLHINGEVAHTATGAAVQGHPAEALALAANTLAARGITLEAGWCVYTGGLTDAVPLTAGDQIVAEFGHLGSVTVTGD